MQLVFTALFLLIINPAMAMLKDCDNKPGSIESYFFLPADIVGIVKTKNVVCERYLIHCYDGTSLDIAKVKDAERPSFDGLCYFQVIYKGSDKAARLIVLDDEKNLEGVKYFSWARKVWEDDVKKHRKGLEGSNTGCVTS